MKYKSKRLRESVEKLDLARVYPAKEAIALLKEVPHVKFDETFEACFKLGVDPKKADQQVRSTVSLPNGTGKVEKVLVFAKGDKENEAKEAGHKVIVIPTTKGINMAAISRKVRK